MKKALPPVIRLFISSTFADMNKERQYFNTDIVPKLRRMCAQRGVSFFSVDLRWGITEEDQIHGNVVPICLREIDNCRPFFIGILGSRYGSILEEITSETEASFPWLHDQVGKSVTEIEMYYGVLRHEKDSEMPNCAFFFRSDRLSEQAFSETESEDKLKKLNRLKAGIRANERIPAYDYDTLNQFEQMMLSVVSYWLDTLFPTAESLHETRKNWYNKELLRDYVQLESMQTFLDSYCKKSTRTLMVYGEGARGKSTALTAWTPQDGYKILINCGVDEAYQYWPAIAHEIVNLLQELDENVGFPEFHAYASFFFRMMEGVRQEKQEDEVGDRANHTMYYVTDEELESFRRGFVAWLKTINPLTRVYIVINDLNLLADTSAVFLNWLPNETQENVHLICSANDDSVLKNAQAMGWNTKEMPLLSKENAVQFLNAYMDIFGKKLSSAQLENLEKSPLLLYPGHLKQIVQYYNNYGCFENLDELTDAVGQIKTATDLYRFMLDRLIGTLLPQEIVAVRNALFILTETSMGLQEDDLYSMVQALSPIDAIGWSRIRVFPEQFQLITADAWRIWDGSLREIVRHFPVNAKKIHRMLGRFFLDQMDQEISRTSEKIKRNTDCAKAALCHYAEAEDWETLVCLLQNRLILYYLSKMEWATVRSMWMRLLMFSDLDVSKKLTETFELFDRQYGNIEGIQQRIISLMSDLELRDAASRASSRSGLSKASSLRSISTDNVSDENGRIYNSFVKLKEQRQFLRLLGYVKVFLDENESELTPDEKCCFLMLKQDAEIQTGNIQSALATVYQYYSAAIAATNNYEILRAVLSRGELLYFAGRYKETDQALKYAQKLALSLGSVREYLSSLNIEGMCKYRLERFEDAVICFETCMKSWKRIGNDLEYVSCWLNKTNALQLSGDLTGAARELELLVQYIRTCQEHKRLAFQEARVLCNLGSVYDAQNRTEEAETAYLQSLAAADGRSDTTPHAYYGLIENYKKRKLFTKAIDVYQQLIEYLYQRNLYPDLARAIKDCITIMQVCNYTHQAKTLQKKWEAVFDTIPGGRPLLDQTFAEASDQQTEDRIRDQLAVAQSESDYEKCGDLLSRLASLVNSRRNQEACDLYMQAMDAFSLAGNRERAMECAYSVIGLLIGTEGTDQRFERIFALLSTRDKVLVEIWLRLRSPSASDGEYVQGINQLMVQSSPDHPLIMQCLISEAERMMEKLPTDLVVRIVEWMKFGGQYALFKDTIGQVVTKDFIRDVDFLRSNYTGDQADNLLEMAEKKIAVLEAIESKDAGAMAGNIAIIYRRRQNLEQTIRHHEQAIRIYQDHNELRDMYIEQMNLATAYSEFGVPEKALNQLRHMLKDPQLKQCPDIHASVSGNLAAFLIKTNDPSVKDEILDCFAIEEAYFENAGDVRELVISLINQLHFDLSNSTMSPDERRKKYLRAEQLTEKHQLREFSQILHRLRPCIIDEPEKERKKKSDFTRIMDIIRKGRQVSKNSVNPKSLLLQLVRNDGDFAVTETDEETGSHLHALLYPKDVNPLMIINVHLWITCSDGFTVEYLFAAKPRLVQGDAGLVIKEYTDWWNEQNDYELLLNRQNGDVVILTTNVLRSLDLNDLVKEYRRIEEFWKVDMMCFSMSLLGINDLENLKEMKKTILKNK